MPEIAQQPPPRKFSLRRWMLRFLVAAVTLCIVVFAVVEIVLSTSIPRRIVIAQVQQVLGLRITADSVSTGWLGHTTLRNVTVSLPLAEHAFLQMPELRVTHTVLPIVLLTQSVDIQSIALDQPRIYVTQDRDGRWNLQDVVRILLRIGGNGQPQSNQQSSPLVLPRVALGDGEIDVKDSMGRQAIIAPLNVSGLSILPLVWQYDASCDTAMGAHLKLTGRVAPNDNFSHELNFSASNLASLLKPWIADFDPAASVTGHWRGAKTADGVAGRLQLRSLNYEGVSAEQGDVAIAAAGDSITASASRLVVHVGNGLLASFAVTGGSFSLDSTAAKANALEISALNGRILANGSIGFADQSGALHVEWKTLAPIPTIRSSGSFDAMLRGNWPDQKSLKVDVATTGMAAQGNYAAHIVLAGGGKAWNAANWTVTAPTLQWSGKQPVVLDHLAAHLATLPGQITLADVSLPGSNSVAGEGRLRFDQQNPFSSAYNWWLFLQGQNWTIPHGAGASLAFGFNAWGDHTQIRLQQAFGIVGRIYAGLEGYYRYGESKPVDLNLSVCELPAPVAGSPDVIQGKVRGDGVLAGTLFPLSLDARGQFHGDQIVIDDRPPQQFKLKFTAGLHDQFFQFHTEELSLLGGEWSLHGQIPARDSAHGDSPDITLRVHDLPLANVGDLIHQNRIGGIAAGSLELDIDEPALDQISGAGHFQATDVRARQFQADSISTEVSVQDGLLELSPIDLKLSEGRAQAKVSAKLSNPQLLTASLDATGWPVDIGQARAVIAANTQNLVIDASTQSANGQVTFDASATLRDRPLLTADGKLGVAGRVVNLQSLNAKILEGDASGSATVDIDHPLASRGTLRWDALNLSELASYNNIYQTGAGFLTGRADLAPTTDPRALGPLMLDIAAVGQSVKFRSVQFTEAHLPIYFDTDRAVLSGGKINIGGGNIALFARASLHQEGTLSTLVEANLDNLDLEQLLHAADTSEADKFKSYPGRLSGLISVVGDPRDRLQLFGSASLQIHDSDLGNFGPFAVLYDTMHLGGTVGKKVGEGTLEARYDNDNLIISSLRYYNRGIDAYGLATIQNLSRAPKSALSGELVGTYQPLKNINLPFFADANKIFSVLQANLTSIVIGGTLEHGHQTYVPESAAAIGSAMRTFLVGDVPEPK
jgi:hypothetical protein